MIWYITGKPRSGKTYYGVHKLVQSVNSNKYQNVYTNIGGFKYDKFEDVKKLDFEDFFDVYIPSLYKEFKIAKKTMDDYDQWLIDKITTDGYYKSVFFVDEAQEYLPNDRVHLKWLFSYQGHLGFDFYFITQNLGLVHAKYKYTIETVTYSVSGTGKLFNNLLSSPLLEKLFKNSKIFKKIQDNSNYGLYQTFSGTKMSRNDKMGSFRLLFKKEVFDLYKSGDKVSQRSPLLGRLLTIILLILLVYAYYQYTTGKMKDNSQQVNNRVIKRSPQIEAISIKKNTLIYDDNTVVLLVTCKYHYCDSHYFRKLPYVVFNKYNDEFYKIIFQHKLKYSTNYYIETTEHNMNIFSTFRNEKDYSQGNSILGGLKE